MRGRPLTVVTPRGTVATRRLPASGAGPAPERLWLGSEGALGVITEAWMRVQRRPRWRKRQLEWQLEWQLEGQLEGCVGIGHLIFVILRLSIPRKTFAHIPTWPDIHSLAAEADVEGDKQSAQGISSSGGRAGGNGNGNGNGN